MLFRIFTHAGTKLTCVFIVVFSLTLNLLHSQKVINEGNYKNVLEEFNVSDPLKYREKIVDFTDCGWDDLTFLNKYGTSKTGVALYGMGNFGWGDQIIGKSQQVRNLGIQHVRAMFAEDEIFEKTAKAGINCTLFLAGEFYSNGDFEGWKKSVEDAVKRYGKKGSFWKEHPEYKYNPVKYYEILGETNIDSYIPPLGVDPVEHYYKYLKAAYEIIKSLDPSASVIAFGTSGGNIGNWMGMSYYSYFDYEYKPGKTMKFYGWLRFIEEVNKLGGYKYYDGIGLDNYSQPYAPDYKGNVVKALLVLREEMKKYGVEDKVIWFSEVGYPMRYRDSKYEYNDQKQAEFTLRLYGLAASHGVEHIQSFHVVDFSQDGDDASMWRIFGFFDNNGNVRKQGIALKTMIELMPKPKLLKTISDGKDDFYAYEFQGYKNNKVIMLWLANEKTYIENGIRKYVPEEKSEQKTINVYNKSVVLVDMYGKRNLLTSSQGKVTVHVSPSPVYVVVK
ncbi:MAG: hypothetical protein VB102_05270 [Paludibacter sp.]|nr:hypothetical protein [Paludibacter sp.]